MSGEDEYKLLRDAVVQQPGVVSAGRSIHLMGRFLTLTDIECDGNNNGAFLFDIGEDYFETIGFELVAGRKLDAESTTDVEEAIVVNETFVEEYGLPSALDKRVKLIQGVSEREYRVAGVVRDFYPDGVDSRLRPALLRITSPDRYRFLSINYIAGMVIIISAMGLFALVSLNIARRTKEIGIRKILGASVPYICLLIAREFVLLVAIGGVLASVVGYFLTDSLLSSIWICYTDFGFTPFVFSIVLVFVISILTVSFRVIGAANANPVEALRYE